MVVKPADSFECGETQTTEHITFSCNIYLAPHGSEGLKELDDDTMNWLSTPIPDRVTRLDKSPQPKNESFLNTLNQYMNCAKN